MKRELNKKNFLELLTSITTILIVCISIVVSNLGIDKKIVSAQEDQSIYLDPVDTAFTVEKISDFTINVPENLTALEETLFFEQTKKVAYLDKKLVKGANTTQNTQLEREYIVQKGDTVTDIANKFSMHVATLYERNSMSADTIESIKPGDVLIIPAYDQSNSKQWLAELNDKKEEERQRLLALQAEKEAEEAAALALANSRTVYTRSETSGRTTTTNTSGYNGYPYGWCTWYVASRRSVPGNWGNAGQWLSSAQSSGYATGYTPQVGAILVTGESWWGHVAIVESVSGGSITISEMNYSGWGVQSSRTISASSPVIKGYVY